MQRRKRVDPRLIGLFVIGAAFLAMAGVLLFGPGGMLSEVRRYTIYFDSSVKGLNIGSPVRFRGVKIGQVRDINVQVSPQDFAFNVPVIIEIEPSRITAEGSRQGLLDALKITGKGDDPILSLVEKGLRAQLQLESLVTGQLYINFDMFPEAPLELSDNTSDYPELPAVSSSLEELTKTLEELPLQELAQKLISFVDGAEKIVTSPQLHQALATLDSSSANLQQLLQQLNEQLPALTSTLNRTLNRTSRTMEQLDTRTVPLAEDLTQTLQTVRSTVSHLDAAIDPLVQQLTSNLQGVEAVTSKATTTLQSFEQLTTQDSQPMEQLSLTLKEMQQAARSLRNLTDELNRDPQMMLRGRLSEEER